MTNVSSSGLVVVSASRGAKSTCTHPKTVQLQKIFKSKNGPDIKQVQRRTRVLSRPSNFHMIWSSLVHFHRWRTAKSFSTKSYPRVLLFLFALLTFLFYLFFFNPKLTHHLLKKKKRTWSLTTNAMITMIVWLNGLYSISKMRSCNDVSLSREREIRRQDAHSRGTNMALEKMKYR